MLTEFGYQQPPTSLIYFRQLAVSKKRNDGRTGYAYQFDYDSTDTVYSTWEEAENAKIFNGLSLKEVSELKGVRFDMIKINGNDYKNISSVLSKT